MKCNHCGTTVVTTLTEANLCSACLLGDVRQGELNEAWVQVRFPQLIEAVAIPDKDPDCPTVGDGSLAEHLHRFLARDFDSGEKVVLHLIGVKESGMQQDRLLADLAKRAHLDHPQIARILDHGEIDGYVYAIEALPAGKSLTDAVDAADVSRGDMLNFLPKITGAVRYAATQGVRFSIRPGCVLLTESGDLALTGIVEDEATSLGDALQWIEDHPAVGTRVGIYELVELIGEGGFAEVYRARQERPFRREVALKILKLGMDTRQLLARFARERQVLSQLKHSGIARIYDAGATQAGRPYIIMELVDGDAISGYCDARTLTLNERARLLASVCRAVEYGHTKGVIHRDLKPSNVLVTEENGDPVPKVIDFGIAQTAEEALTANTVFTRTHQFVGSPSYMSPEQVEGKGEASARSDVYGLGCLLYELLVGEPPLPESTIVDRGLKDLMESILHEVAEHPVDRVSRFAIDLQTELATSRSSDRTQLVVDLSARGVSEIALKALSKKPDDRYPSAAAMADDLDAWVEDMAVVAPRRRRQAIQQLKKVGMWGAVLSVIAVLAASAWDWNSSSDSVADVHLNPLRRKPAVSRSADGTVRPVALFQFDGDLKSAIPGGPDMVAWGDPQLSFEKAQIGDGDGDSEAEVLHFPRFTPSQWLKFENIIGINGPPDATETNRFTLVYDVMFPSLTGPTALFQCHSGNFGDAELYVGPDGVGSRFGLFYGNIREGEWYRIAIVSTDNGRAQLYSIFVNGTRWGIPWVKGYHSAGYAFCDEILLFCEGDQRTGSGYINSFALYDVPLTDGEIRSLGTLTPDGLPDTLVPVRLPALAGGLMANDRIALVDTRPLDMFGSAVATTMDEAWVSAPWADVGGASSGIVHRYRLDDRGRWQSLGRLPRPADLNVNGHFGTSLAMTDRFAVVGAPGVFGGGAAYFYRNQRESWGEAKRLKPDGGNGVGAFGSSVALAGATGVIVGNPTDRGGAVFVFDLESGQQLAALGSQLPVPGQRFGNALSTAGATTFALAVAAPGGTTVAAGPIELFSRDESGRFASSAVIAPPSDSTAFGARLALSPDGLWLAASSAGAGGGTIYLFHLDAPGEWQLHHEFTSPDEVDDAHFGSAIAFVSESRLLLGASEATWDGRRTGVTHVYVHEYDRDTDVETWSLRRTIAPAIGSQEGRFGSSIASAGDRVWIGGPKDHTDRDTGGAAYPVTLPRFEDQKLPTVSPFFVAGSDVAIAGDLAAVGSPGIDNRAYGGELQIYRRSGNGEWQVEHRTENQQASPLPNGSFGRVAVGGGRVATLSGQQLLVYEPQNGGWEVTGSVERATPLEIAMDGGNVLSSDEGSVELFDFNGSAPATAFPLERTWNRPVWRAALFDGIALLKPYDRLDIVRFDRSGSEWATQPGLAPPADLPPGSHFGSGIDHDGHHAIIGDPAYDGMNVTGPNGAAYIYDLGNPGATPASLWCPETEDMPAHGWAVAIRGDIALISNPYVQRGLAPGRVYLFRRDSATRDWHHAETLQARNAEPGDEFGVSLGLDDGWAVIGAKSSWVYFFKVE
ncbi:MAG: serine/threonine protein kinase [Verrucomicrobiales bacterium]|jgi:serine/threonine protein kinase